MTAWSLLGSFDWDSLVTRPCGHYEPGAFDVRGPKPRPTALAQLVKELATHQTPTHPVLNQPGWWHRPGCRIFRRGRRCRSESETQIELAGDPILITGATGKLGQAFARICAQRGLPYKLLSRREMDIADPSSVQRTLDRVKPWALINAAGYVDVDDAEHNAERCYRENVVGPTVLAAACERRKLPLVTFSSDLVFDGTQRTPYAESDSPNPLGVYGRTQAECEKRVQDLMPSALIVRSSTFFSPWDQHHVVAETHRALERGEPCYVFESVVSPTYLPDLVHVCLDLVIDRASGIWHLAGEGEVSWADLVRELATRVGLRGELVRIEFQDSELIAPRPLYSALQSERGVKLPRWSDALDRYVKQLSTQVLEPISKA